jgi:hypothetical protein
MQFSNMLSTNAPSSTLEKAQQFARADARAWCVQNLRQLISRITTVPTEIRRLPAWQKRKRRDTTQPA